MHETVIGMNKIYLGFKKFHFYPRYYVAINRRVIEQGAFEISSLNCVKFIGTAGANGKVKEDALTYLVNTNTPKQRFGINLADDGLHEGWTVTYAALQVAYYLGFKEVVIIGMDHRYEYTGKPNEACRLDGPDPNHFSPTYFGGGQTWDNPDLAHSEESYFIARGEYERAGRRIIDATLGGACAVFEKADYRQIFQLAH